MTNFSRIYTAVAFALCTGAAQAQFNLNSWLNFEQGVMPPGVILMHNSNPQNTRVAEYARLGKPEILAHGAASEIGRFGLELKTDEVNRFLSIAASSVLQRDKLGESGRALFQVDIFLDGQTNIGQTMAVLGVGVDPATPLTPGTPIWRLYRFGVLGSSQAFFSFTDGTATPKIYLHEKLTAIAPSATNGWHRFQFVVEGSKGISCYVDGIKTSYSPIAEGTFRFLQPGVLVGAPAEAPMTVIMDNLSIQWTLDPLTPMPTSPWIDRQELAQASERLLWETDFNKAVEKSKTTGKPLLALFYVPGNESFQELNNNILQNSEEARAILEPYIPVRIDMNQLMGANLARELRVVRVPTMMALGPDGIEKGRVVMLPGERWSALRPKMQKELQGSAAPATP
jgi:hypothetical protein